MDLKVSFSKTAEKNLDSVLKFIEARWSEKSKKIFIIKFEKAISIMMMNPARDFSKIIRKQEIPKMRCNKTIKYII